MCSHRTTPQLKPRESRREENIPTEGDTGVAESILGESAQGVLRTLHRQGARGGIPRAQLRGAEEVDRRRRVPARPRQIRVAHPAGRAAGDAQARRDHRPAGGDGEPGDAAGRVRGALQ